MIEFDINKNVGGSLTSLKWNGVEYLHQPSGLSWKGQDHCIFPFVGRLKDGYYTHKGEKYELMIHGLLNYMKPEVVEDQPTSKTIRFTSNEETLRRYPFKFDVLVFYKTSGDSLEISMKITNFGDENMPFANGWHPAIRIPFDQIGEERIMHPVKISLVEVDAFQTYVSEDGMYLSEKFIKRNGNVLCLCNSDFVGGASTLIDSRNIDKAILETEEAIIEYELNGAPVITIWSVENQSDYICIEPWWGMPDVNPLNREITEKYLMTNLKPGESITRSYKMTFKKK